MDIRISAAATTSPPPSAVPPRGSVSRVLLALGGERSARRALRDAFAFARALGAELHVIRVVPHVHGRASDGPLSLARALRESQRVVVAGRHARALCDRVLVERLPSQRIGVRLGAFTAQVAERAAELRADIIVLGPHRRRLAGLATCLASRSGCAVLVAKGRPPFSTLLAATDLEDEQIPVLRRAARLGSELNAAVVALHAVVDPASRVSSLSLTHRREALERAALGVGSSMLPLLLSADSSAQCILEGANAHAADLIIVGTRTRATTAARVLEQARRSVLVAPIRQC
jgi:nucleotide-binding universal stress UspA family protein